MGDLLDEVNLMKQERKPPPITCPLIDNVLGRVKTIEKLCSSTGRYAIDDIAELRSRIESEMYGIESVMEEIRTANEQLRDLSFDWYKTAKSIAARAEAEVSSET